jgi:hypothetical protein
LFQQTIYDFSVTRRVWTVVTMRLPDHIVCAVGRNGTPDRAAICVNPDASLSSRQMIR